MAELREKGQFILDLELTSGGHVFLLENSLNGSWAGLKGGGGVRCQGLTEWVTLSLSVLTL